MKTIKKGIYIHIPFCNRKCNYCDFTTIIGKNSADFEKYTSLLLDEIKLYKDPSIKVDTIYIGGGTPSLLPPDNLKRIMDRLSGSFSIQRDSEITIECNPNTIKLEDIKCYKDIGINRVSLGVQCFQNRHLKLLGRDYPFEKIVEDSIIIREGGIDNLSFDLIYGFSGQKMEDIKTDIQYIDQLQPKHISWYNLIVEEMTLFGHLYKKGRLSLPSEKEEEDLYLQICKELEKRSYFQYELSNFSKPGYESKHNLKYWHNEEYYGFGLGASGYLNNMRYKNHTILKSYELSLRSKKFPLEETEELDENTLKFEYIIMHMRLKEGLSLADFEKRFGIDLYHTNEKLIKDFICSGHLVILNGRMFFTQKGFFISNYFLTKINY